MYDTVQGVEVGGEGSVVLFWVEEEFGEALNCVRRGDGEEGRESLFY